MPSRSRKSSSNSKNVVGAIAVVIILILGCIFIFTGVDVLGIFTETTPAALQSTADAPHVPTQSVGTSPLPATALAPAGSIPNWLAVFFTVPIPPDQLDSGMDRQVVGEIQRARQTIDLAAFDLNLPSMVNALVEASKRGVTVRVVIDGEEGNLSLEPSAANGSQSIDTLKTLKAAKIRVVNGGRSNGLMHNKIILIDGKVLYMGSWNPSYNDTFRNDNNLLRITAPELIANYQAKFNESFEEKKFGARAEVGALQPELVLDGVRVENYFSTVDEVMTQLTAYVRGAKKSVRFIAFTYTHPDLADAMIERFKKGVKVEGVIENRGASQGAMVPLFCAKVPVRVDGNKYTMHHKVILIDDQILITGSFNFTKSADEANDDNILVIHDPAVVALYLKEYQRVWGMAAAPDAAEITCK